ncbi:MAG: hypothetical protein JWM68_2480 [Verrucomicrobiales bacterium]|nr:hypothetical protein [Verrucomicrobiales bacterium]
MTKPIRRSYCVSSSFLHSRMILLLLSLLWAHAASAQVPYNDDFTNRVSLSGTNATDVGSNVGATSEPGETSLGLDAAGKTIWWTWRATASGTTTIWQQTGSVPHLVGVCTGDSVSNLIVLATGTNVSFTALAGETYCIAVDGFAGAPSEGSIRLRLLQFVESPVNDMFTNATVLTGTNLSITGSSVKATRETGEPSFAVGASGKTVWWNWTAPAKGLLRLDTYPYQGVRLAVFTGEEVEALMLVPMTNAPYSNMWRVNGGTTYRIGADAEGLLGFSLKFDASPPNDMFADRTVLNGDHIDVTENTYLATLEPGEPQHRISGFAERYSVWWSWTATSNGVVAINKSVGLTFYLAVYTGDSLTSLRTVTKSDNGTVTFAATAGTAYQIAIANEYQGSVRLKLDWSETPANDFFANRFTLTGTNVVATASNANSSYELDEPKSTINGFSWYPRSSLWWTWTAPCNGKARFNVGDCAIYPMLAIFTGDALTTLTQVASGDLYHIAELPVTAGQTYQISVGSLPLAAGRLNTGNIVMRLAVDADRPPNDAFTNRITLTGTNIVVAGTNTFATIEPDEELYSTNSSNLGSVWWTWTAPFTGTVTMDTETTGRQDITVSTGSSIKTLKVVAWGVEPFKFPAQFQAIGGTTYQISVASPWHPGEFVLHLNQDLVFSQVSQPMPTIQIARVGDRAEFHITASGEPPLRYQWRLNGMDLPGATGDTLILNPVEVNMHGDYTVAVTDANQVTIVTSNAMLVVPRPPANDMFSRAAVLSGTDVYATGSNIGATPEPELGEYRDAGGIAGSIWWVWTAPYTGDATISALGGQSSYGLAVLTDKFFFYNPLGYCAAGGSTTFPALAGTKYWICVDGLFEPASNSRFHLIQNCPEVPRITLQPTSAYIGPGMTISLSVSASGGGPLRYQWRKNGNAIVGANKPDFILSKVSKQDFALYDVVVTDAFGSATSATARLYPWYVPPVNDAFTNATFISGMTVHAKGSSEFATQEPGEPLHLPAVWWKWTAPADGEVVLSTYGTVLGTELAVYTGDTLGSLIPIASQIEFSTNYFQLHNILRFHAQKKTTYRIGVATAASYFSMGTDFTLNLVQNHADWVPSFFADYYDDVGFVGNDLTWPVHVFGREPMHYQWQYNGVNIRNQTNATLTIHGLKLGHAGSYRLLARNPAGVSVTPPRRLWVFPKSTD